MDTDPAYTNRKKMNNNELNEFLKDNAIAILELAYQSTMEDNPGYEWVAKKLMISDEGLEDIRGHLGELMEFYEWGLTPIIKIKAKKEKP